VNVLNLDLDTGGGLKRTVRRVSKIVDDIAETNRPSSVAHAKITGILFSVSIIRCNYD
jgi:hypothetical protein